MRLYLAAGALAGLVFAGCSKQESGGDVDLAHGSAPRDFAGLDTSGLDLYEPVPDETMPSPDDLAGADLAGADLAVPDLAKPKSDMASAAKDMVTVQHDLPPSASPTIAGCSILPSNHIFNTPIANLPTHANSDDFIQTIGNVSIHLDLGQTVDQASANYYGIPYNVVHGGAITWATVAYTTKATGMSWNPRPESDCAKDTAHTLVSPCTAANAPTPLLPIPGSPLVEGGILADVTGLKNGDHHILIVDQDSCRLWEVYHAYTGGSGVWDIFGSATWDLGSNALRPKDWTSADAAGFPILPLLLREDEAASGTIKHALRFTIESSSIRPAYVWPARHLTTNGTDTTNLPPMGQLFRLKDSYQIPSGYSTQSKAILQALKTYGMYLADGGSNLYIQGEPNAAWSDTIFDEVQTVGSAEFEAVDISAITSRAGFNVDSGAVPPP